jgi:prepilin-type N-terminal cleavage/methylation domain-containing protein
MPSADCKLQIAEREHTAPSSALRAPRSEPQTPSPEPRLRSAFTLMELLIVITIIAILSGLVLSGLASAVNDARVARTRAQIQKIDTLIMERYESYRTRPVRAPSNSNPLFAAQGRVSVIRELQRMELPDRRTDIFNLTTNPPTLEIAATGIPIVSLQRSYARLAIRALGGNSSDSTTWTVVNNWSRTHEGSECLYLILATMKDGDKSALD